MEIALLVVGILVLVFALGIYLRVRRATNVPSRGDLETIGRRILRTAGPITPLEALRETVTELAEGQRRIAKILEQHVEETDPTYIKGIGRVLLPEPIYHDFLERASGTPPSPSTRLAYENWVAQTVPTYEEWLIRIYPTILATNEVANVLAAEVLTPVPAQDGAPKQPLSAPSAPHTGDSGPSDLPASKGGRE